MFLFRASVYLDELRRHAPAILDACNGKPWPTGQPDMDFIRVDTAAFAACPSDLHRLCGHGKDARRRRGAARRRLERRRLLVGAVGDPATGRGRQRLLTGDVLSLEDVNNLVSRRRAG